MNEVLTAVLEFAMAYDLAITKTYFAKSEQLVTFKSGTNESQIDIIFIFNKYRLQGNVMKEPNHST